MSILKRVNVWLVLFIFILTITAALASEEKPMVLDLEKSIQTALQNSNSMKKAESKIKENIYKEGEVFSAWLPQLGFNSSYIRTEPVNVLTFGAQQVQIGELNNYKLNLALTQLVYSFGRVENSLAVSKLNTQISQLDKDQTTQELILRTKAAYFNILRAKNYLKVAQDNVRSAQSHLKTSTDFFQQGIAPRYDTLRMETQLASANEYLIQAENNLKLKENDFKNILNIDLNTPVEIIPEPENAKESDVVLNEANLVKFGLDNRPESKKAKEGLIIAQRLIDLAYTNNNPNLGLAYNYNWRNPTNMSLKETWDATALLSIPIFDGWNTRSKVKQAKEVLKQTQATADDTNNYVILEIKQCVLKVGENKARVETARKSLAQANESLSIAEVRYQAGLSTATELTDTQVSTYNAQFNYWSAFYDYRVAIASLERATDCSFSDMCKM